MVEIALILSAHAVLAEFIDVQSGNRISPPSTFTPHDVDQRQRLIAARCISAEPVASIDDKPVEDMTRAELEQFSTTAFLAGMASASDDDLRNGVAAFRARAEDDDDDIDDGSDDLAGMTAASLRELAAKESIDLGDAKRKPDMLALIRAARAQA